MLQHNGLEVVNHTQFWSIQGVMNEGDLVRLKTRYPIWLYSFGLSDGDFGVITKIDEKEVVVYWFKIRRMCSVQSKLIEIVQ